MIIQQKWYKPLAAYDLIGINSIGEREIRVHGGRAHAVDSAAPGLWPGAPARAPAAPRA
jgi:hypothetical protein